MVQKQRWVSFHRAHRVAAAGLFVAAMSTAALSAQISELQSLWVSPTQPTVDDMVILHAETTCSNPFVGSPTVNGFVISLDTEPGGLFPPCPPPGAPVDIPFNLGKLIAGSYTVDVFVDSGGLEPRVPVFSTVFQVLPVATSVDLLGARFRVRVTRPSACTGTECTATRPEQEAGVRLADNAAAFTFVDSNNIEVAARVLDGSVVNGGFWVFVASMTDQAFTVTVTDLHTPAFCVDPVTSPGDLVAVCVTKTYDLPSGVNQNVIDLNAFTGQ